MRFAVMGAGQFGSRYGGWLVHAGLDVTFVARGQRYADIKRDGLHTPPDPQGRRMDIAHVQVTNTPAEVGPVDVVIFAVKNYHLEEAAAQMTPLLGDATVVLPMQNGVTAAERLATIVGRPHVLGYATSVPTQAIGELDGPVSPEIRQLLWEANEEAAAVARAEGVNLAPGIGDSMLALLDSYSQRNPRWRPSLLQDLDAGRRMELEDLVGVLVHKGTQHGIPTPVIRVCYMTLKPYEMGTPRP